MQNGVDMDLSQYLPILPLRYVISSVCCTVIISSVWYWVSTPGPSIGIDLVLSLFIFVYFGHLLVFRLRTHKENERNE